MSDDNSDEIMIGPMPAVEDYSALTLTTIEPEDNTEGTTLVSSGRVTINQHNNNNNSNSNDHNNTTNGFDNNNDYGFQENAGLANPPSPQALFFLSEMGDALDSLTYDHHILELAETNKVNIPWTDLKPIVRNAILKQCDTMETVVTDTEVISTITGIKTNILHCIDHHSGTPFTIQRLCELISAPTRYYTLFIKYLHAIEKVLSVASTWDSFCEETPTQASSQHLPSQQQEQQRENDLYTGYEMPEVILSPKFDDGVDIDNGNDDDDQDDDEDDEDDKDDKDMADAVVTEDVDSMEVDNAAADQQAIQTNGTMTTNDHKDDAMHDDKDMDQDLEQDREVSNSSNNSSSSNSSSNQ